MTRHRRRIFNSGQDVSPSPWCPRCSGYLRTKDSRAARRCGMCEREGRIEGGATA